jgi:ATP sulfurylase
MSYHSIVTAYSQVKETSKVYGVTTLEHPAVQMVAMERGRYYLGGKVQVSESRSGGVYEQHCK